LDKIPENTVDDLPLILVEHSHILHITSVQDLRQYLFLSLNDCFDFLLSTFVVESLPLGLERRDLLAEVVEFRTPLFRRSVVVGIVHPSDVVLQMGVRYLVEEHVYFLE
jgi:hypothetical protein